MPLVPSFTGPPKSCELSEKRPQGIACAGACARAWGRACSCVPHVRSCMHASSRVHETVCCDAPSSERKTVEAGGHGACIINSSYASEADRVGLSDRRARGSSREPPDAMGCDHGSGRACLACIGLDTTYCCAMLASSTARGDEHSVSKDVDDRPCDGSAAPTRQACEHGPASRACCLHLQPQRRRNLRHAFGWALAAMSTSNAVTNVVRHLDI